MRLLINCCGLIAIVAAAWMVLIPKVSPEAELSGRLEWKGHQNCQRLIENSSRWDYKWTGAKFDVLKVGDVFIYTGDRIKMQNGFGAWQRMKYECKYDTSTNRVWISHIASRVP